jgi:uncharacterized DUF497 family protein
MAWPDRLRDFESFDWDASNIEKLWRRHHVTPRECEELFFDDDTLISYDSENSCDEERYRALGRTAIGCLYIHRFYCTRTADSSVIGARYDSP